MRGGQRWLLGGFWDMKMGMMLGHGPHSTITLLASFLLLLLLLGESTNGKDDQVNWVPTSRSWSYALVMTEME